MTSKAQGRGGGGGTNKQHKTVAAAQRRLRAVQLMIAFPHSAASFREKYKCSDAVVFKINDT